MTRATTLETVPTAGEAAKLRTVLEEKFAQDNPQIHFRDTIGAHFFAVEGGCWDGSVSVHAGSDIGVTLSLPDTARSREFINVLLLCAPLLDDLPASTPAADAAHAAAGSPERDERSDQDAR